MAESKMKKPLSAALKIFASLALVILVPLGIRSCLLSEGNWVTCRLRSAAGEIQFRVYPERAPLTVANFLRYVEAGLYNDSTFFRIVTPDNQPNNAVKIEVIQGGDVDEKKCFPPVAHETTAQTGLKHRDGTVSMARNTPGTATSSFFICIGDQPELDFGGQRNPDGQGFAAFGRVVKGMEVVRKIQRQESDGQYLKKPVVISSLIRLLKPSELPGNTGTRPWRGSGIGVIGEAVKAGFERMTPIYYLTLLLVLALAGWLGWRAIRPPSQTWGWRGFIRQRWARGEAPVWEGSDWAAGRETRPWVRVLALVAFLVLASLFGIMLIGM